LAAKLKALKKKAREVEVEAENVAMKKEKKNNDN
jgi:hypothetical protein